MERSNFSWVRRLMGLFVACCFCVGVSKRLVNEERVKSNIGIAHEFIREADRMVFFEL